MSSDLVANDDGDSTIRSREALVCVLPGGPDATVAARRALAEDDEALPAALREDVLLLVTELVSNAVRHADVDGERSMRLEMTRADDGVRVEVTDPGSDFAHVGPRSPGDSSGGWGLYLVDRIADHWGVRSSAAGTCVWFEIGPG